MIRISRITSLLLACNISVLSIPSARASSAILAPALCSTGVGCIFVGAVTVGSIVYYVWRTNDGKQYRAKRNGTLVYPTVPAKKPKPLSARGRDFKDVAHLGNVHWAINARQCYKMGISQGWTVKEHYDAKNGGTWCVFHGKQTSFARED